jgi:hypothetical protein
MEKGDEHRGRSEAETDMGRAMVRKQTKGEKDGTNLKNVEKRETPERAPRPRVPEQRGVEQATAQAAEHREDEERIGASAKRHETHETEQGTYKGSGNAGENPKRPAQVVFWLCHSRYSGRSEIPVERAGSAALYIAQQPLNAWVHATLP